VSSEDSSSKQAAMVPGTFMEVTRIAGDLQKQRWQSQT
jgi:hypothetical protein